MQFELGVYIWSELPQDEIIYWRVSCWVAHCAGVISWEAPLLVVGRGGKEAEGGAKKERQGERFHSHQQRQFTGISSLHFIHAHCLAWSVAVATLLLLNNAAFGDHHLSMAPAVLTGKPSMRYNCWASSSSLSGSSDCFDLTPGYTCSMTSSNESQSIFWNLAFPTLNSSVVDEKWSQSIPVAEVNCWEVRGTCNHLRRYLLMCCWIVSTHEREIS